MLNQVIVAMELADNFQIGFQDNKVRGEGGGTWPSSHHFSSLERALSPFRSFIQIVGQRNLL